jgi:hypothetical protein
VTRTALLANAGKQIAELAIATHLPSSCPFRRQVIAGGLVSLDADRLAMPRPAAAQIDKIIKGASAADISRRAADALRAVHQFENRPSAEADHPARAARIRRRGDRMRRRDFISATCGAALALPFAAGWKLVLP